MRTFTHLRGQMWLLPFLAVSFVQAQTEIGLSVGPQLVRNTINVLGIKETYTGFGFLLGGGLAYEVAPSIKLVGDLLLSYETYKLQDRETFSRGFFSSYEYVVITEVSKRNLFMKLPLTARYVAELSSVSLEVGGGLQPYFWLSSNSKVKKTEDHSIDRNDPDYPRKISTVRTESNFAGGSAGYNRIGISAVLLAGLRFSQLGVYVRFDPMLSSMVQGGGLGTIRQSTIGVMGTYWISR